MPELRDRLDQLYQRRGEHYRVEFACKRELASALALVQFDCPVVTITGTNGKTSCAKALAAMYQQAGWQTALFTSPHLQCFNERIQINGTPVSDAYLGDALSAIMDAIGDEPFGFFDITCFAALYLFQQAKPDIVILEVGIGGRYDTVNIVDADVAVITSLGLDHQAILGLTLDDIAWQKAGIMRAQKPVVLGAKMPQVIYDYAKALACPVYEYGLDFNVQADKTIIHASNIACAQQVIQQLQARLAVVSTVLQSWSVLGRLSVFAQVNKPSLLIDVAHNPQSCRALANFIQEIKAQHPILERVVAVVAMLADKDQAASLKPLAGLIDQWYVACVNEPRGFTSAALQAIIQRVVPQAVSQAYDSVAKAVSAMQASATARDLMVVFGSNYTVAEALNTKVLQDYQEVS